MDFAMMLLEKGDVAVSPGSGFGEAGEGFSADGFSRKRKSSAASGPSDRTLSWNESHGEVRASAGGQSGDTGCLRSVQ